jgi:hypothetical protein
MGMELLILIGMALVTGLSSGIYMTKKLYQIKEKADRIQGINILGYTIIRQGALSENVKPMTEKKQHPKKEQEQQKPKKKEPECDFCLDETEIRINGSKEIIPCPKCKLKKAE